LVRVAGEGGDVIIVRERHSDGLRQGIAPRLAKLRERRIDQKARRFLAKGVAFAIWQLATFEHL
jgi:hypothetical protein